MTMSSEHRDDPMKALERDTENLRKTIEKESSGATAVMHDARDAAKEKASQLADEAKAAARKQAESAQQQASSSLHAFASAVRSAGEQLEEKEQGTAARLVREAATGLEQLSTSLADKPLEQIMEDVRSFGRRNPTAFIAGSVLAGIALGRFMRSTASDNRSRNAQAPRASGTDGHVEIGARPGAYSAPGRTSDTYPSELNPSASGGTP